MGNISDDFLSKNIDAGQSLAEKSDRFRQFAELILAVYIGAGGKIIFCEPVHRVFDCKDRLCEISGAYANPIAKEVWRISPDGEPRDAFNKLRYIFDMNEETFFERYAEENGGSPAQGMSFLEEWHA